MPAKILVVDDETAVRVLLAAALERAGYRALVAGNGLEAIDVLRRMGADIAIAINPDQTPGFDLDPEMVAMVAALLPEEAQ